MKTNHQVASFLQVRRAYNHYTNLHGIEKQEGITYQEMSNWLVTQIGLKKAITFIQSQSNDIHLNES